MNAMRMMSEPSRQCNADSRLWFQSEVSADRVMHAGMPSQLRLQKDSVRLEFIVCVQESGLSVQNVADTP